MTRLWRDLDPATYSTQQVSDEFENNFEPLVTGLPGFRAYIGAPTLNVSLVFFANVFETEDKATAAQVGAAEFMRNGVLRDKIVPYLFTQVSRHESCGRARARARGTWVRPTPTDSRRHPRLVQGVIRFQFLRGNLCGSAPDLLKSMYLSLRAWLPQPNSSAREIVDIFEKGFAPVVQRYPGFQVYLGADVVGSDSSELTSGVEELAFFLNVFETADQAAYANRQAVAFVRGTGQFAAPETLGGVLSRKATLLSKEAAHLDFAFFCKRQAAVAEPSIILPVVVPIAAVFAAVLLLLAARAVYGALPDSCALPPPRGARTMRPSASASARPSGSSQRFGLPSHCAPTVASRPTGASCHTRRCCGSASSSSCTPSTRCRPSSPSTTPSSFRTSGSRSPSPTPSAVNSKPAAPLRTRCVRSMASMAAASTSGSTTVASLRGTSP